MQKKETNVSLMKNIYQLVNENGHYEKAKAIMDYFTVDTLNEKEITAMEFDFVAVMNYGGSEGIYVDCYIEGRFDEKAPVGKTQKLDCGTFKTLREDVTAAKIMGELSGALGYYARKYLAVCHARYQKIES